jgi:Tfp pilus assembly protein PilX
MEQHSSSLTRKATRIGATAAAQKGVVLFIALIVLVAMTLAGIALVRSVDTSNVIAGNLAFKQGTLHAADLGVEAAVTALPNIIATTLEADQIPGSNYLYYATRRTDCQGVTTTQQIGAVCPTPPTPMPTNWNINWNTVPVAATVTGNTVQIVIDRLCRGPAPVTDIQGQCFSDATLGGGSKKAGAPEFTAATKVYYRVTARVSGPRNTVSMVQTILSR